MQCRFCVVFSRWYGADHFDLILKFFVIGSFLDEKIWLIYSQGKVALQVFLEEGYSKQLFLWLYSVLLVVQKPLLHDVCASLRSFAKQCRLIRAMLTDDGSAAERGAPTTNEFSLFVALVSIYFEQKDLADHQ